MTDERQTQPEPDEPQQPQPPLGTWDHTITCDKEGCDQTHNSRADWPPPDEYDPEDAHNDEGWTMDPETGERFCPTHSKAAQ